MTRDMRVDAHIHIDPIDPCCVHHATPPPSPAELTQYAEREKLGAVYAIYENAESLQRFANCGVELIPLFWLRNTRQPEIPAAARGIKLHPYLDKWELNLENLSKVLPVAQARGLFLFIHTEDREPRYSRPRQAEAIAREFPQVRIILAHAGSYSPPGRVRLLPRYRRRLLDRSRKLIREAALVTSRCPNVYLETSILHSRTKAKILSAVPARKLLLGTDFPILARSRADVQSLAFQERQLMRFGMSERQIMAVHRNAAQQAGL